MCSILLCSKRLVSLFTFLYQSLLSSSLPVLLSTIFPLFSPLPPFPPNPSFLPPRLPVTSSLLPPSGISLHWSFLYLFSFSHFFSSFSPTSVLISPSSSFPFSPFTLTLSYFPSLPFPSLPPSPSLQGHNGVRQRQQSFEASSRYLNGQCSSSL